MVLGCRLAKCRTKASLESGNVALCFIVDSQFPRRLGRGSILRTVDQTWNASCLWNYNSQYTRGNCDCGTMFGGTTGSTMVGLFAGEWFRSCRTTWVQLWLSWYYTILIVYFQWKMSCPLWLESWLWWLSGNSFPKLDDMMPTSILRSARLLELESWRRPNCTFRCKLT